MWTTEVLSEMFGFAVPSVCFCFGQPIVWKGNEVLLGLSLLKKQKTASLSKTASSQHTK